jgi:hypothetical protein
MKHATQCLVSLICAGSLIFSLSSCSSGGGEGAPLPVSTTTQTIVSGTVQAPGGQIAFFKKSSFRDLFVLEAYAALTGLANVPDNTIVQLARLDANASSFSVISTTSTSGGLYSFNLTALGLQPANDLIVRVAGSGGKEMRAFVVGTVADISPVSEAAYQLTVQSLNGGPINNLTLQEVSDISGAVGLISTLQDLGTAISIDQTVGLIKSAVRNNPKVNEFLAAAAATGQTTVGAGDIGNFYPFEQGSIWRYRVTRSLSGSGTASYENTVLVSGQGPDPWKGVNSTIFSQSNADGDGRPENMYAVKDSSGITSYGSVDLDDNITHQLTPYSAVHFPLTIGVSVQLIERSGLDWGQDEDGDVKNETFNMKLFQTALEYESISTNAGTFPTALRVEEKAVFVVIFSRGGDATVIQTNTLWLVPNIGLVKRSIQAQVQGGPLQPILTEELTSYVVNGKGGGLRLEVTAPSSSVTLGGTLQLVAKAFDQSNNPIPALGLTWDSSNHDIVTINQTGEVTGVNLGQASIHASLGTIISNDLPVTVQDIRVINLETSDLIYDGSRQYIYTSVPTGASVNPDRILVINPESGTIVRTIFVGDNPGKLALSDNHQYLYVAVSAPAVSVRRINLLTGQIDLSFSVGTNIVAGQLRVDDMEVIPGSPQSLVVARMYIGISPRYAETAIFDNGVQRPNTAPFGESINILEFGATATKLYGADREGSGGHLSSLSIGPSGLNLVGTGCCSFDGRFDTGLIYSKDGRIIDPELRRIVGVLPGVSLLESSNDNLITTDSNRGRVYLLKGTNDLDRQLLAFDRTSLSQIGAASLSSSFTHLTGVPSSLILWGTDGLAFRIEGYNKLVLLRTSIFH